MAVVAAVIGLAVRPYVQTVRGHPGAGAQAFIAALQQAQGLRVDPSRLYAEDSLYWVIWYIGLPALLLAGVGLALLTRRSVRALLRWQDPSGAARNWALPLLIIGWGAAVVLWLPETAADQPWASRRLVPLVLPGLVLAAIWAAAWLTGRARSRGAGLAAWSFVSACCVVALLVPTMVTTTGFGLTHRGAGGSLHPVVNGLAARKTNAGEPRVTGRLCGAIGRGTAVVIIGEQLADQFAAPVRTICDRPVAWVAAGQAAAQLPAVINGIEQAGHRPVLLAASRAALRPVRGHRLAGGQPADHAGPARADPAADGAGPAEPAGLAGHAAETARDRGLSRAPIAGLRRWRADLPRGEGAPKVGGHDAGRSSSVARWAHNPEVAGSNPAPATK